MNYKEYLSSPEWKKLRNEAIKRDNGKCTFCNRPFIDVHHVKYPKRFSQDHIDNLLVVCRECHNRLHGIKNDDDSLLDTIHNRLEFAFHNPDSLGENCILESNEDRDLGYKGIDMGSSRDLGREENRKRNFDFIMDEFADYLPNMTFENFKLHTWKGSVWWGDEEDMWDNAEKEFDSETSENIIFWIIKNKWGKNGDKFKRR